MNVYSDKNGWWFANERTYGCGMGFSREEAEKDALRNLKENLKKLGIEVKEEDSFCPGQQISDDTDLHL